MNIVTVTCERDLNQLLIQTESISKFVDSCCHWIVVNEPNFDYSKWYNLLSPYYTSHTLKIISFDHKEWISSEDEYPGYLLQQLYKFLVFDVIQDSYLILDSKNFFIKDIDINYYKKKQNLGYVENYPIKLYQEMLEDYSKILSVEPIQKQLSMITPFLFEEGILKTLSKDILHKIFISRKKQFTSEFYLYSLMCQKNNRTFTEDEKINNHFGFWGWSEPFSDWKQYNNQQIKSISMHRIWLYENLKEFSQINEWLRTLGFKNELDPDKLNLSNEANWKDTIKRYN